MANFAEDAADDPAITAVVMNTATMDKLIERK